MKRSLCHTERLRTRSEISFETNIGMLKCIPVSFVFIVKMVSVFGNKYLFICEFNVVEPVDPNRELFPG